MLVYLYKQFCEVLKDANHMKNEHNGHKTIAQYFTLIQTQHCLMLPCLYVPFCEVLKGVLYIYFNLGILAICTKPLNGTSCMS